MAPHRALPHYAASGECECCGSRAFDSKTGGGGPAPLPRISGKVAEQTGVERSTLNSLDAAVNEAYSTSYLAPLLPMTRSQNWEIRRGSITCVACCSDDHLRAAAATLRNLQGKSVLRDLVSFSMSEMCTMPQRREAVLGLVNLVGHKFTHEECAASQPRALLVSRQINPLYPIIKLSYLTPACASMCVDVRCARAQAARRAPSPKHPQDPPRVRVGAINESRHRPHLLRHRDAL